MGRLRFHGPAYLIFFFLFLGCSPPADHLSTQGKDLPKMVQDGFEFPYFPTAQAQLHFAKSGFTNKKEKSAALRAVLSLYPDNRLECGQAAMALAYLHLEPDYRFALPIDIRKAANDFNAVLKEYSFLSDIQAKALWYLGWIHIDLEQNPKKGLPYYWRIVRDYPEIPMNLSAPVPWINLVYPQEISQTKAKQSPPLKYWSQIALLEIVRHAGSTKEATQAFDLLFDRFFTSPETGFALKIMLADEKLAVHAQPKVTLYLARYRENPHLVRDIKNLAKGKKQ